jgi:16S rRNA (guanine527-N7)-methyltransferase
MTVSEETWRRLLAPYIDGEPPAKWLEQLDRLDRYLQLLLRWNDRINLTAVREAERMIERHFGESLFAARYVPRGTLRLRSGQALTSSGQALTSSSGLTLLDHGSGAGFPGLPIALARPEIAVTLSESMGKKAAFLREVVRELQLSTEVVAGRTEDLPAERLFDCVTMRAVDCAAASVPIGAARVAAGGTLLVLGHQPALDDSWSSRAVAVPNSPGQLWICTRDVPRGTFST